MSTTHIESQTSEKSSHANCVVSRLRNIIAGGDVVPQGQRQSREALPPTATLAAGENRDVAWRTD